MDVFTKHNTRSDPRDTLATWLTQIRQPKALLLLSSILCALILFMLSISYGWIDPSTTRAASIIAQSVNANGSLRAPDCELH